MVVDSMGWAALRAQVRNALCWVGPGLCVGLATAQAPSPAHLSGLHRTDTITLPAVDAQAMRAEDARAGKGTAFRYGAEIAVNVGIGRGGRWVTLVSGERVWTARIRSPGARSIGVLFSAFKVPDGAGMFAFGVDPSDLRGSFSSIHNRPNGRLSLAPVRGDTVTVQYVVPPGVDPGELHIGTIVHDYRGILGGHAVESGSCELSVACPAAAPWANQVRATVQILVGGSVCSGVLLNNTSADCDQLCITAEHCGDLSDAVFRFGFQRPLCNAGVAPTGQTVQGSTLLASDSALDFQLVRITEPIPPGFNAYYAGWDRSGVAPTETFSTHHPLGRPKEIAFDEDAPNRKSTMWEVADWESGVTERGSSGGPLYSSATGLFIGQLCCGDATCGDPVNDMYGRLDSQWSQVSAFLDPLGTGATAIGGVDPLQDLKTLHVVSFECRPLSVVGQTLFGWRGFAAADAGAVAEFVTASPPDVSGQAGGFTPLTLRYRKNENVTLSVRRLGPFPFSRTFVGWNVAGVPNGPAESVSLPVTTDLLAIAFFKARALFGQLPLTLRWAP